MTPIRFIQLKRGSSMSLSFLLLTDHQFSLAWDFFNSGFFSSWMDRPWGMNKVSIVIFFVFFLQYWTLQQHPLVPDMVWTDMISTKSITKYHTSVIHWIMIHESLVLTPWGVIKASILNCTNFWGVFSCWLVWVIGLLAYDF